MSESFIGIIPIFFGAKERDMNNTKYFSNDYFDNFTYSQEKGDKKYFTIKPEFLYANFKDFLINYNQIIELKDTPWIYNHWDKYDSLIKSNDIQELINFIEQTEEHSVPCNWDNYCIACGMEIQYGIIFYLGSRNTYFEEYKTFLDMERLLKKAVDNPLSKIAKFCLG